MLKRLLGLAAIVVLAYVGLVAYLYFNQRAFFYFPDGRLWAIEETGLTAVLVTIPTEDGAELTGWHATPEEGMPTLLYLKGNAGSFSAEHERFAAFAEAGYGFLSFDYRGFPASPGTITQESILADALAAFDWLAEREERILVWGRSLGAAPAVYVASLREPEAVLLETPFYSAATVAAERYPYVPVGLLMLDPFPSHQWMAEVTAPVFVAHGTQDQVISVSNGERLFAETPNGFDLWIEEGADHGDLWGRGLWDRARAFFEAVAQEE